MSLSYNCSDPQEDVGVIRQVDPTTKEVTYNPRYEEMFSPEVKKCLFDFFSHQYALTDSLVMTSNISQIYGLKK